MAGLKTPSMYVNMVSLPVERHLLHLSEQRGNNWVSAVYYCIVFIWLPTHSSENTAHIRWAENFYNKERECVQN